MGSGIEAKPHLAALTFFLQRLLGEFAAAVLAGAVAAGGVSRHPLQHPGDPCACTSGPHTPPYSSCHAARAHALLSYTAHALCSRTPRHRSNCNPPHPKLGGELCERECVSEREREGERGQVRVDAVSVHTASLLAALPITSVTLTQASCSTQRRDFVRESWPCSYFEFVQWCWW